jgi:MFS family permease
MPAMRVLTSPLYGRFLDRYPLYYAVVFSLIMAIIGSIFYAMASSPLDVVISRAICGLGNLMTINYTYIGVAIDSKQQTSWSAKIGGVSKLGMLIAPALNAAFVKIDFRIDYVGDINQLTMPGWTMAIILLLMLIGLPFFYYEPPRSTLILNNNDSNDKKDIENGVVNGDEVDNSVPQIYSLNTAKDSIDYETSSMASLNDAMAAQKFEQQSLWSNVALLSLCVSKFCSQFLQMVFETMVTVVTNGVYQFTPFLNSLFYAGCAVLAIVSIAIVGVGSQRQRISDRQFIYTGQALFGGAIGMMTWRWYAGNDQSFYTGLLLPGTLFILALPFTWSPVSSLAMKVGRFDV